MTCKIVCADVLNWLRVATGAVRRGLLQPFTVILGDPPYLSRRPKAPAFRQGDEGRQVLPCPEGAGKNIRKGGGATRFSPILTFQTSVV
jgi:hypothetical protein